MCPSVYPFIGLIYVKLYSGAVGYLLDILNLPFQLEM